MDGIITHHQLNPSNEPGRSTLTLTGEGLGVMMDLEEKTKTFPNQNDAAIVSQILSSYTQYGLTPKVVTPESMETPIENNTVASQRATDLEYVCELAKKYNYVFYIESSDKPEVNTAYWGPADRTGKPQKTLKFNMGQDSNINTIDFQMNALKQTTLTGSIQDPQEGKTFDIPQIPSDNPGLAAQPITELSQGNTISKQIRESGLSKTEALTKKQTDTANSADAITATGELDSIRYTDILKARHLVTLQGAGQTYNGLYYVKTVKHTITKGTYNQNFTLNREGTGTTV
jgi:phage protein D